MVMRKLEKDYLRFLNDYTSIDTTNFSDQKPKSGKFCDLIDCTTYSKLAIRFNDKISADEFDRVLGLLITNLGDPDLFSEYDGYVWKKKGYIVTFGFVSLNYNRESPMITIKRNLSIFSNYVPYEKYSEIANAISEPLLKRGVDIQKNTYYKINYWREFGYCTVFRSNSVLMHIDYKRNKLTLTIARIRPYSDKSEIWADQDKIIRESVVNSAIELNDALSLLLDQTKQYHGLFLDF